MRRIFFYEKEEQEVEVKEKAPEEAKKLNKLLLGLLIIPLLAILLIAAAFAIIYFEKDSGPSIQGRSLVQPVGSGSHQINESGWNETSWNETDWNETDTEVTAGENAAEGREDEGTENETAEGGEGVSEDDDSVDGGSDDDDGPYVLDEPDEEVGGAEEEEVDEEQEGEEEEEEGKKEEEEGEEEEKEEGEEGEDDDSIPTLIPYPKILKDGDIKVVAVPSGGQDMESFGRAVDKCKDMGGNLAVAETEEQLSKIFAKASEAKSDLTSPMVFTGMRFTLNDWAARDGTNRIYNGVVSSLWQESYKNELTSAANCSVVADENGELLLAPVDCDKEANCYACQTVDSECANSICYELVMDEATIDTANDNCKEKKAKLALPGSHLMLTELLKVVKEVDVNKKCKSIAIGFVRDIHLEDFAGNRLDLELTPFNEQRTKLTDTCLGFDLILSKQFTRASCTSPNGAICTLPDN